MEFMKKKNVVKPLFLSDTGIALCLFLTVFVLFLAFPRNIREGVSAGIDLCVSAVVPSLFPYAVLSSCFVYMRYPSVLAEFLGPVARRLFSSRGEVLAVWFTGTLSGFPIGGRTAAKMCRLGQIDRLSAEKAAAFSNCPSPAFVIAFCGGVFDSPWAGLLLFLILTAASFISGIIVCRLFRKDDSSSDLTRRAFACTEVPPSFLSVFTRSCVSGGETMVAVCSYVLFFSALLSLIADTVFAYVPSDSLFIAIFYGVFELTSGISCLNTLPVSQYWLFVTASFILSLSGLCANMQVISFLKEEDLSVKPYAVGRMIIVLICSLISALIGLFL